MYDTRLLQSTKMWYPHHLRIYSPTYLYTPWQVEVDESFSTFPLTQVHNTFVCEVLAVRQAQVLQIN